MDWLFIILLLGVGIYQMVNTTPEERILKAKHRHETNNRLMGGGFNLLGFFLKRLR